MKMSVWTPIYNGFPHSKHLYHTEQWKMSVFLHSKRWGIYIFPSIYSYCEQAHNLRSVGSLSSFWICFIFIERILFTLNLLCFAISCQSLSGKNSFVVYRRSHSSCQQTLHDIRTDMRLNKKSRICWKDEWMIQESDHMAIEIFPWNSWSWRSCLIPTLRSRLKIY